MRRTSSTACFQVHSRTTPAPIGCVKTVLSGVVFSH